MPIPEPLDPSSDALRLSSPSAPEVDDAQRPLRWRTNLALFIATVVSVFLAGAGYAGDPPRTAARRGPPRAPERLPFAVPLLAILLTHEFGHYFAARYHKVDASLPYFIPLPS